MPKFPEPPPAGGLVARLPAAVVVLAKGTLLWRLYRRGGARAAEWHEFRDYGPLESMRFDHHEEPARPQARKILYGAAAIATCVAEVFQEDRAVDRNRREPWLVGFELARDVTLLDLRRAWPTAAGASMALNSGGRARARRWSVRIYEDYPRVQGLWYPSSMNANQPAFALYERAEDALPDRPVFHRRLSDPGLDGPLVAIVQRLNYLLLP